MGCSTSSYVFQATQWVLVKKWRRLGIRLMNYSDNYAFFCKRHEVPLRAAFLQSKFEAHGLELNIEKSNFGPERRAVVLGIGIDLERGTFNIPPGKKTKINRGIKEFQEANRRGGGVGAGAQVSARLLAKTVGRIMALHVVCGNVVRRLTRGGYGLIAKATGMPPDIPWRLMKVTWDKQLSLL
jgi:hypothetical protein